MSQVKFIQHNWFLIEHDLQNLNESTVCQTFILVSAIFKLIFVVLVL